MLQTTKDPSPLTVTHGDQSRAPLWNEGHSSFTILLHLLPSLQEGELSAHGANSEMVPGTHLVPKETDLASS